ncbi:MAG: Gfo/Idh/MocA family protein [Candidatus Bipolaricaulaceae bacterium]
MKVGLIGAGNWGRNLARTLYELEGLGAIAEIDPETRADLAGIYPDIPIYAHHRELLSASDILAVVIATPAATHYEVAKEALLAGKHVFVEKPLALRTKEAEELLDLARSKGRTLMVGHLLLYQPAIPWIKQFIRSGGLGKIWSIHQERLKLGTVRTVENVLWSFGVHDLAVLLYLTDLEPEEIQAQGQATIQKDIEDDVYLHLRFPNGLHAHLHVSWLWPERQRRLTIIGEKGMLVFDEINGEVTLHKKFVDPRLKEVDQGSEVIFKAHGDPLKMELKHFLDCVAKGEKPLSDGESAVRVVRVLEKATEILKGA